MHRAHSDRILLADANFQGEDEAALDARREVVRLSVKRQLECPDLFLGHPKLDPPQQNKLLSEAPLLLPPPPPPQQQQQQQHFAEGGRVEQDHFEDAHSSLPGLSREQSGMSSSIPDGAGSTYQGREGEGGGRSAQSELVEGDAGGDELGTTLESTYEHFMVPKEKEDALPELFLCLEVRRCKIQVQAIPDL